MSAIFNNTNQEHPIHSPRTALVLILGFLEFTGAAIVTLIINRDPKNAFLFGYSISRLVLFLFILSLGIGMLVLAIKIFRGKPGRMEKIIRRVADWTDINFLLFLTGCLAVLIHPSMLGNYRYLFERLQPFLVVSSFLPIQFSIFSIDKIKWQFEKRLWIPEAISLCVILFLMGFIAFTRLGITPDKVYWNVAGMPLASSQLIMILSGITIGSELFLILKKFFPDRKWKYLDLVVCLLIFLSAVLVWNKTPFNGHFFAHIGLPYNQPFPFSDARGRDIGALSITLGNGINFGGQTVSPLYEVFLALLHGIAGYDYTLITRLQLLVLALIPVVLYLFGKEFHGRYLGILIAGIVIVRQSNAILLSRMIASSNPFLLTTEMPTYLATVVLVGVVFLWLKKNHKFPWMAFFSGGVLGMASLIRVNPIVLFPAVLVISLAAMWKAKKKWLGQVTAFCIGFLILITPWVFTGTTEYGQSFFLQKFYNVIEQRYEPIGQIPTTLDDDSFFENTASRPIRLKIITATEPVTIMDIYKFPGFVVNHYLHNIVTTFLAIPDSFSPSDQILTELALRPYWVEQAPWQGELKPGQIGFLILNIALVSMGIGWSWKRWQWVGMIPIFFYLVYLLSLGFARVSGSRYLVPVDWVIFFYYSVGLVIIIGYIAKLFKMKLQGEIVPTAEAPVITTGGKVSKGLIVLGIIFLLGVSASIPIADNNIARDKLLCEDGSYIFTVWPLYAGGPQNAIFLIGRVLYPSISDNSLTFTFFNCIIPMVLEIEDFEGEVESGQIVIAIMKPPLGKGEIEMLMSYENQTPLVLWERK